MGSGWGPPGGEESSPSQAAMGGRQRGQRGAMVGVAAGSRAPGASGGGRTRADVASAPAQGGDSVSLHSREWRYASERAGDGSPGAPVAVQSGGPQGRPCGVAVGRGSCGRRTAAKFVVDSFRKPAAGRSRSGLCRAGAAGAAYGRTGGLGLRWADPQACRAGRSLFGQAQRGRTEGMGPDLLPRGAVPERCGPADVRNDRGLGAGLAGRSAGSLGARPARDRKGHETAACPPAQPVGGRGCVGGRSLPGDPPRWSSGQLAAVGSFGGFDGHAVSGRGVAAAREVEDGSAGRGRLETPVSGEGRGLLPGEAGFQISGGGAGDSV